MKRDGIPGERLLVNVRMADLAAFLNAHPLGDPGLEHVFDYYVHLTDRSSGHPSRES